MEQGNSGMAASANGAWALVTGGASGIGAELCRLLAQEGYGIVLVDRDAAGMDKMARELTARVPVQQIEQNLAAVDAAPHIVAELKRRGLEIEILINNAGFGTFGPVWEVEMERDRDLIQVNVTAPVLLTKLLLPPMIARGRGRVLNVGSVSGFGASPYATCYYSSKAFLLAFSTGVQSALEGTGVTCTLVCPGPTRTAFDWREPGARKGAAKRKPAQMDAATVAKQAYAGMLRGQAIVIPGWTNKALALMAKFLPRRVALALVKRGQSSVN